MLLRQNVVKYSLLDSPADGKYLSILFRVTQDSGLLMVGEKNIVPHCCRKFGSFQPTIPVTCLIINSNMLEIIQHRLNYKHDCRWLVSDKPEACGNAQQKPTLSVAHVQARFLQQAYYNHARSKAFRQVSACSFIVCTMFCAGDFKQSPSIEPLFGL